MTARGGVSDVDDEATPLPELDHGTTPLPGADTQRPAWAAPGAAALALVALTWGLVLTSAAAPTALLDPGPVVRWGRPVSDLLVHGAAVVSAGAFMLCALVLPRETISRTDSTAGGRRGSRSTWQQAAAIGAGAALAWAPLQVLHLVLTHAAVSGTGIGGPGYLTRLGAFLTEVSFGEMMAAGVVLTTVVAVVGTGVRTYPAAAWCAGLALLALVPTAATGHAATGGAHGPAMSALWLHLGAVTWWTGGLIVLVLLAPRLAGILPAATARYSTVAGWCFIVVAASGVVNAWTRLPGPAELFTSPWGQLLLAKVVLFGALGAAGWWHRRATLPALDSTTATGAARSWPFWRLAGVEVAVMGAVVGLSVALGAAEPPAPPLGAAAEPGSIGGATVPPPTAQTYLTQWQLEPLFALMAIAGAVVYLSWARRLRRRGDAWPLRRTASWMLAMVLFAWLTNGGPSVYGHLQFSTHMAQHMSLVMILPILYVLASPVTLALRAVPRRDDGSRGPREWLLALVQNRWSQFFATPVVAALNVVVSMALFYFSPLFELALRNHLAHVLMVLHFSVVGYLLLNVLIGTDPGPTRPPYPVRLALLLPSMVFHTFFGLVVLTGQFLLAGDYFHQLQLPWLTDPLTDQQVGAALTWAVGELPILALGVVLALQWASAMERAEQRQRRTGARAARRHT